jgi:threonine dehydratase
MLDLAQEIVLSEARIRSSIRETPLELSKPLSKLSHTNLFLKCENLQYTGAFKVRGAFNYLLSLDKPCKGIVAASTGNHGAAIGYALSKLNIPGTIFVPENTSSAKIANIKNYDVELIHYGNDSIETELYALEYANDHGLLYVSPYNHLDVIKGQGTIGVELLRQNSKIDAVFVPVGGGGLIAGIGAYIKSLSPSTKIIGCLPENSPVMAASMQAGHIVAMESLPTLSDATAGGIEDNAITFDLCKTYVDDYVLVSEQAIRDSIVAVLEHHRLVIEGASGVALAGCLQLAKQFEHKNVAVVLSGGNISLETLKTILLSRPN